MTYTDTKICRTCSETKSLDDFYPVVRKTKNGTRSSHLAHCKPCCAEINRQNYRKNVEDRKARQRQYRKDNPEKVRESFNRWRANNYESYLAGARRYRENHAEKVRSWFSTNKDRLAANCAKRRAFRQNATPAWLTDDQNKAMTDYYWLAKDASAVSDTPYHVDHIIPLNNEHVCGLHVPWNMQILPADLNIAKSNSFDCWWID